MLEELARIPVEVEYASEFRYRNPVVDERTLVIAISQSGETADTLAAIHEAKLRGARTLGLVNVVGSTIAREVDGGLYLRAGPEVGVASHQGVHQPGGGAHAGDAAAGAAPQPGDHAGPGHHRGAAEDPGADPADPGSRAGNRGARQPVRATRTTRSTSAAGSTSRWRSRVRSSSRKSPTSTPRDIPAAEMKHGPIALIDENMPVVFIAPQGHGVRQDRVEHRGGEGARRQGDRDREREGRRDDAADRLLLRDPARRSTC